MTNVLYGRAGGLWEGRGGQRERDEWNNNRKNIRTKQRGIINSNCGAKQMQRVEFLEYKTNIKCEITSSILQFQFKVLYKQSYQQEIYDIYFLWPGIQCNKHEIHIYLRRRIFLQSPDKKGVVEFLITFLLLK